MEELNYFTTEDSFRYRTISIPKELFVSKYYKGLSNNARVIYGFLIDRTFLSIKNGWVENGHPYIYFQRKDFEEILNVSNKTIINAFKELNEYKLIYEVKQGIHKPNKIFPLKYKHDENLDYYVCKNYTSRNVKNTSQEVKNLQSNNTNNNKYKRTNNHCSNFIQRDYPDGFFDNFYSNECFKENLDKLYDN